MLHITSLPHTATEEDVRHTCSAFGHVVQAKIVSGGAGHRYALAEFDGEAPSTRLLRFAQSNAVFVQGQQVRVAYARRPKIELRERAREESPPRGPPAPGGAAYPRDFWRVLFLNFTDYSHDYRVDADSVQQALMQFNLRALRVVVFTRGITGEISALVEMPSNMEAKDAVDKLNGQRLYENGCTIKAEISKKNDRPLVVVEKNDERRRDFEALEREAGARGRDLGPPPPPQQQPRQWGPPPPSPPRRGGGYYEHAGGIGQEGAGVGWEGGGYRGAESGPPAPRGFHHHHPAGGGGAYGEPRAPPPQQQLPPPQQQQQPPPPFFSADGYAPPPPPYFDGADDPFFGAPPPSAQYHRHLHPSLAPAYAHPPPPQQPQQQQLLQRGYSEWDDGHVTGGSRALLPPPAAGAPPHGAGYGRESSGGGGASALLPVGGYGEPPPFAPQPPQPLPSARDARAPFDRDGGGFRGDTGWRDRGGVGDGFRADVGWRDAPGARGEPRERGDFRGERGDFRGERGDFRGERGDFRGERDHRDSEPRGGREWEVVGGGGSARYGAPGGGGDYYRASGGIDHSRGGGDYNRASGGIDHSRGGGDYNRAPGCGDASPAPPSPAVRSPALLVSGFPEKLGAEALFNLFSVFGHVVRVKPLHRGGAALVLMCDPSVAAGAAAALHGVAQFGGRLAVEVDRVERVPAGGEDGEGRAACEFGAEANRFRGAPPKAPFRPSSTVYFLSAPTEDPARVQAAFVGAGAKPPLSVTFQAAAPHFGARRCGYAEYASVADATEALMLANNVQIDGVALRLAYGSRVGAPRGRDGERAAAPAGRSARSRSRSRSRDRA